MSLFIGGKSIDFISSKLENNGSTGPTGSIGPTGYTGLRGSDGSATLTELTHSLTQSLTH